MFPTWYQTKLSLAGLLLLILELKSCFPPLFLNSLPFTPVWGHHNVIGHLCQYYQSWVLHPVTLNNDDGMAMFFYGSYGILQFPLPFTYFSPNFTQYDCCWINSYQFLPHSNVCWVQVKKQCVHSDELRRITEVCPQTVFSTIYPLYPKCFSPASVSP